MATNPPESIVNAGMRLINIHDNHIYEYLGNRWVKLRKAKREDYNNIPQLIWRKDTPVLGKGSV